MFSKSEFLCALLVGLSACLAIVLATPPSSHHTNQPPTIIIKPQPTTATGLGPTANMCPVPSQEMLRCIRQWACQYIIRLDLRCLLNLNGNPLLGSVLGGGGTSPAVGGGAGNGGLLGGILGI